MATKTKIYLAVIAIGLIALVADRCYFGASTPASTAADEIEPASEDESNGGTPAPRPRPSPQQANSMKLSVPELHFPRNLPLYDPAIEMRDIFAQSQEAESIAGENHAGRSNTGKKGNAEDSIGRESFQTTHHVDAVMVQESLKIALINGRWMRVGDVVDSCKLTGIAGDSIVFQCHDGDAVLFPSGKRRQAPD